MRPSANGCRSPWTIEVTEFPPNIQAAPEGTVNTGILNCSEREICDQRRSMRRVARSEPLYRRADVRQQPYLTSGNQRHNKQTRDRTPEQLVSGSRITNDDIQAAATLLEFATKHLTGDNDEAPSNVPTTECVANSNNDNPSKSFKNANDFLLRIAKSLEVPDFTGSAKEMWKKNILVKLMVSPMTVRQVQPSMPVPVLMQQAMHVAEQLVNHARLHKMPDEQDICCLDCGMLPVLPVTGQCGHTRCLECITNSATCTCGTPAPQTLHVNTCVQYLIGRLLANNQSTRVGLRASEQPPVGGQLLHDFVCAILGGVIQENCQALARRRTVAQRLSRGLRVSLTTSPDSFSAPNVPARMPMTPQARVLHACFLILRQCYLEAAAHLARAAAVADLHLARRLLAQTVGILIEDREPELVAREVSGYVDQQAAKSWLTQEDLECVLCRGTLVSPITTPCGHTYCHDCIECSMDYQRTCPLCMRDLNNFNLALTGRTQFVCAALASIDIHYSPPPFDPSVIPVFACVTAFPNVPCPFMVSDPRYRVFVRRILESGSRRLGMVARNADQTDSHYGTMLEIRDCVECHDGRMILSTMGISRFKIVERIRNGCLARVEMLTDEIPTDPVSIRILQLVGSEVGLRACVWVTNLECSVRSQIVRAYGSMPIPDDDWWTNPTGPDWLWWLIASLPLAPKLKGTMISSSSLLTRLCAMRRVLELVVDASTYDAHVFTSAIDNIAL